MTDAHLASVSHAPVLRDEVLAALALKDGDIVVDGTLGLGGYSQAFLKAADCRVFGIDRDPTALAYNEGLVAQSGGRLVLLAGCFGDMKHLLATHGIHHVNAIALDLGVSSPQLDQAERGFSFQQDGPLDMRMGDSGPTAADVVNDLPEKELADILYIYGEERRARQIAAAIVRARKDETISRTQQLVRIIESVLGKNRADKIHPATRSFQALRIHVNDELGELSRGLHAAEEILLPEGRLAVVTFHSLEDRMVKQFLARRALPAPAASRHSPAALQQDDVRAPSFRLINRQPVSARKEEVARNPRARSAKLRAAQRTSAPSWPVDDREARP